MEASYFPALITSVNTQRSITPWRVFFSEPDLSIRGGFNVDGLDVFPIQSRRAMAGSSSLNAWDLDGRSIRVRTPRFFCKPHLGDSD